MTSYVALLDSYLDFSTNAPSDAFIILSSWLRRYSLKITRENVHSWKSEFQKKVNLDGNSSEFGTKICIFTLTGVTSRIIRKASSDPWGQSKEWKFKFSIKIHSYFILNSLFSGIHSFKSEPSHSLFLESNCSISDGRVSLDWVFILVLNSGGRSLPVHYFFIRAATPTNIEADM